MQEETSRVPLTVRGARGVEQARLGRSAGKLARRWYIEDWQSWRPRLFEWYFTKTRVGSSTRAEEEAVVWSFVDPQIRPEHHVLDVGSGTGIYTARLVTKCSRVFAVEASPAMRSYLTRRMDREGEGLRSKVEVLRGRLPEPLQVHGSFDGVVAIGVLNYVENLDAALKALAAPLSVGGWAVFRVPPDTDAGRKYLRQERLLRRRVYVRSDSEVVAAANGAGLTVQGSRTAADVTRVVGAVFVGG